MSQSLLRIGLSTATNTGISSIYIVKYVKRNPRDPLEPWREQTHNRVSGSRTGQRSGGRNACVPEVLPTRTEHVRLLFNGAALPVKRAIFQSHCCV